MNASKFFLVLFWLFPVIQSGFASSPTRVDSLEGVFRAAQDDSSKASILSLLFDSAEGPDRAKSYLERGDDLLKNGNCPCCEVTHMSNWASYYNSKGEYQKAESQFLKAIELFKRSPCDEFYITSVYLNTGQNYQAMGELEKAVEFITLALEKSMESGQEERQLAALNNLGIVYFGLGQYAQAEDYYSRALSLAKEAGNLEQASTIQLNLGNIRFMDQDYQGALLAFRGALEIGEATQDSSHLPSRYINVGVAYYGLEKPALAIENLNKGLQIARIIESRPLEANALRNLANVSAFQGNYPGAIRYIRESLEIYKELKLGASMSRAYPALAGYYEKTGQFKLAY